MEDPGQRRGRKIAMSDPEVDAFLGDQHTCRVASTGPDGFPHVTPVWFVWDGDSLWIYSLVRSQRWKNLVRDPRVSVVIDSGTEYFELRGIQLTGAVEPVGEQPRVGDPNVELETPERLFAEKYTGGSWLAYDERHAWLRLTPSRRVSWDFRKLSGTETAFSR